MKIGDYPKTHSIVRLMNDLMRTYEDEVRMNA
ncbi:MAG: hypothetical protein ACTSWP_09835 [Candidatus Freyarchaeota archaeon]